MRRELGRRSLGNESIYLALILAELATKSLAKKKLCELLDEARLSPHEIVDSGQLCCLLSTTHSKNRRRGRRIVGVCRKNSTVVSPAR